MKLTLTDVKSGYNLTPLNTNFEAIEQELQNKVLYRDNPTGEPNQMEGSLDMNSYDVQNVRALDVQTFTIQGTDSTQFLDASVQEAFNWAQYPEDQPVPEGNGAQYSAFHYSQKAQEAEAAAELALYNFNGTWYGSLASEPTVDPNGNAPTAGDIYLNSTDGIVYFYQGGIWNPLGGGNVTSIFGRTGAVVASAGDYTAAQVTYSNTTSGLTATDAQAAIDEVEGRLDTVESSLIPYSTGSITVNTGDFVSNPWTLFYIKNGGIVHLWFNTIVQHTSSPFPTSGTAALPAELIPSTTRKSTIEAATTLLNMEASSDGRIGFAYYSNIDGTAVPLTQTPVWSSITYAI